MPQLDFLLYSGIAWTVSLALLGIIFMTIFILVFVLPRLETHELVLENKGENLTKLTVPNYYLDFECVAMTFVSHLMEDYDE